MLHIKRTFGVLALLTTAVTAWAAGGEFGQAVKQPTNWTAITIFALFVIFTLFITKLAAAKTKSAAVIDRVTTPGKLAALSFVSGASRRDQVEPRERQAIGRKP
jgi:uncharacterized membrane protein YkvI